MYLRVIKNVEPYSLSTPALTVVVDVPKTAGIKTGIIRSMDGILDFLDYKYHSSLFCKFYLPYIPYMDDRRAWCALVHGVTKSRT